MWLSLPNLYFGMEYWKIANPVGENWSFGSGKL